MCAFLKFLISTFHDFHLGNTENWECIVITAADAEQKKCFEEQLKSKVASKDLPSQLNYMIISDPPGPVLGAGGATLHALQKLESIYGETLYTKKVLIIHAGKQRCESSSQKIFV